ncbi:MAG TPA: glycosyltransferase family 39 protein, partial [Gaiellaceae bacterium]|nr:glycosyltransferase family 39 protein [Gaiellaceae bacterium]
AMGSAAREYVAAEHDLERVAERYAAALEQAAGDALVREQVLAEVAAAAAEVGVETEPLAAELVAAGVVSADGRPVPSGHVPGPGPGTWPKGPMWLWLGGLYAVAATVLLWLGLRLPSPWIMVDELIYSDMARSFAATGHFLLRGESAGYAPLYPLLISPVYAAAGPVSHVYDWIRVVNGLLLPTAVFPAYLLARRVVKPPAAFVAAVLAIAVPSAVYVGTVMTENLFYPLFLWLALSLTMTLERPTAKRQLILLATLVVAFEARQQGIVLVAAALTAPLVLAWIERGRPRSLARWAPLYGITVGAVLVTVVVELALGHSATAILGKYSQTSSGGYHVWPVLRWLVLHVAEIDLYVWVVPFAALIVLVANARHLDARLRAYSAATAALSFWLVLEIAVFASRYSLRIEDRYLFYLAPLLVISLLAWIERGQPKPPRAAVVAAGLAAALPGTIPFLALMNVNAQSDTVGIQPWWYLGDVLAGRASVSIVATLVAIGLGAAFLWLPRRWAPVLPVVVGLGFLLTWLPLELWTHSFPTNARNSYRQAIGSSQPKSWIDARVGRDAHVAVLWAGGNKLAVWENEFWNRSVRDVYDLVAPLPGNIPSTPVAVEQSTGILRDTNGEPIAEPYVLTSSGVALVGQVVARDTDKRLVLYRVRKPARTVTAIAGLYPEPNPWSDGNPVWTRFQCAGGKLVVVLRSDDQLFKGVTQTVTVSGTTRGRSFSVPNDTSGLRETFPLRPQDGVCRVAFAITPTRRPVDFPRLHNSDTRVLGLHFDVVRYVPPR